MLLRFRSAAPLLRPRTLSRTDDAVRNMSGRISRNRTGTTAALWNKRFEMEQYKKGATKPQEKLVEKPPSASHMSIALPVSSDADIHDQYANFRGGIQFGKLLEDIDAFAGNIAFLHCDDGNPETKQHRLVTASVDRLDLSFPITLGLEDLLLTGSAGWAGRSSVQIDLQVSQALCGTNATTAAGKDFLHGSVVFVAVNDENKGVPINPLIPATVKEKAMFKAGEAMNLRRKMARKTNLNSAAPTEEEIARLHKMMMAPPTANHVPLSSTTLDSVRLMQPQQRNRAGKIFGGYLMHKAYELAFATASKFSVIQGWGAPTVFAVDDVSFAKPVSIGDVITFTSTVVYTGADELRGAQAPGALPPHLSSLFQVRVGTKIVDLKAGTSALSNEFHFSFFNRSPTQVAGQFPLQAVPVVGIVPHSYREGMLWVDGRRRMLQALDIQAEVGGVFAESIGCTPTPKP